MHASTYEAPQSTRPAQRDDPTGPPSAPFLLLWVADKIDTNTRTCGLQGTTCEPAQGMDGGKSATRHLDAIEEAHRLDVYCSECNLRLHAKEMHVSIVRRKT